MWYGRLTRSNAGTSLLVVRLAPVLLAGAFLSACTTVEERIVYRDRVNEVEVPVPTTPDVPDSLRAPVARPALDWRPEGPVCLSNEDAGLLRDATWQWLQRLEAWEAWAK